MSNYNGDKLTKNEIMMRLNNMGVFYDKNNNSKQYFIELYNKVSKQDNNNVNDTSSKETKPKQIPNQSSSTESDKQNDTYSNNKKLHSNCHQKTTKKGGLSLSLIILAVVLAFIVAVIQLQRGNKQNLLEQFPKIYKYDFQLNQLSKKVILPLMDAVIKSIKPYISDKLIDVLIDTKGKITNDEIMIIIPLLVFTIIFCILLLYCICQRKTK